MRSWTRWKDINWCLKESFLFWSFFSNINIVLKFIFIRLAGARGEGTSTWRCQQFISWNPIGLIVSLYFNSTFLNGFIIILFYKWSYLLFCWRIHFFSIFIVADALLFIIFSIFKTVINIFNINSISNALFSYFFQLFPQHFLNCSKNLCFWIKINIMEVYGFFVQILENLLNFSNGS